MKSVFSKPFSQIGEIPIRLEQMLLSTHVAAVESIALYRCVYALAMLTYASPHLTFKTPVNELFYSPPFSIAAFFAHPPSAGMVDVLRYLLAIALMWLLIGYKTFMTSLAVTLLMVLIESASFSSGKINHGILLAMVPLCLAFSAWGSRFSLDAWRGKPGNREMAIPLGMLALVIAVAMFTAGVAKANGHWLSWEFSAVRHFVYDFWVIRGHSNAYLAQVVTMTPNWLWELQDIGTVLFECAGLAAVFSKRYFRYWLVGACFLHLGIAFMLGIHFSANIVAYAAFVPWALMLVATRKYWPAHRMDARSPAEEIPMSLSPYEHTLQPQSIKRQMVAMGIAFMAAVLSVAVLTLMDSVAWAPSVRATLWNATIYLSLTIPLLLVAVSYRAGAQSRFAEVETDDDRDSSVCYAVEPIASP